MTESGGGEKSPDEKFQELWQYAGRVVAFFVRRYGASLDDARDLKQEVYLKVHRSIDSYRGEAKWAFLEQIAHRVANNAHRAQITGKRSHIDVHIDDEHDERFFRHEDEDLAERDERERKQRLLHAAIQKLPDGQRQALTLWMADLSYRDIEKSLRISEDAVKTRLKEAKARLRKMLGPESGASELLAMLPEDES